MMDGRLLTEKLLAYARAHLHLSGTDEIYVRNVLLSTLGEHEPWEGEVDRAAIAAATVPDELAEELRTYALEKGLCTEADAAIYVADVFGRLTPLPSAVNEAFCRTRAEQGPQAACDELYDLCVKNGYIQKTAIARNLKWTYADGARQLEITVNLSKPEKNNKDKIGRAHV